MTLTDSEKEILGKCRAQVNRRRQSNMVSLSYYESDVVLKNMNIAVPPQLAEIGVCADWPQTIVNAYHERMNFIGFVSDKSLLTSEVDQARVTAQVADATLSALVYGIGFLAIENPTTGGNPEEWQIRSVSPLAGTALWDVFHDRPRAGYRKVETAPEDESTIEVLYLPGTNVTIRSTPENASEVIDRRRTFSPIPAMARIRNGQRVNKWYGASAITKPVRYYTDAGMRTLLGMEINREFYTTPQRWAMNADMSQFLESDNPTREEKIKAGWDAAAGKMLALPPPEPGDPGPVVGQFSAAPPTPYLEQLRGYSQMVASATGMPSAYLGFTTENPPSADAIRAWTERLVRTITAQESRMTPDMMSVGWLLENARMSSTSTFQDFQNRVRLRWENPATETLAANVDAGVKLVSVGAVSATSDWFYDLLRMSQEDREEQRRLIKQQQAKEQMIAKLAQAAGRVPDDVKKVADKNTHDEETGE